MNSSIARAEVYLDEDMPEYMGGIIRIESLIFYDSDDDMIDDAALNNELVDNAEYHSEEELITNVAKRLGISPSVIEIIA